MESSRGVLAWVLRAVPSSLLVSVEFVEKLAILGTIGIHGYYGYKSYSLYTRIIIGFSYDFHRILPVVSGF